MSVLVRDRRGHRETKGESCEDGGREQYSYKPGNIRPWGPPWDLKVVTESVLPQRPWKGLPLSRPRFWTSDPPNCELVNSVISPPTCGNLLWHPSEMQTA